MPAAYLDCNATTPVEAEVVKAMQPFWVEEYGNPASPEHLYGTMARMAVEKARREVAAVVGARPDEVIFTSGATESNNLALCGLAEAGRRSGRTHLISTAIEHKAVLEPLEHLRALGFEITLLPVTQQGTVSPANLQAALRPETLCVSVMHVNNETGIVQPLEELSRVLDDHPAWIHVDAAQGYGKELDLLRLERIDLISISAHKIFGPKGVGALVRRRRAEAFPPLQSLMYGGGQEQGLRPGTLPVPQLVGFGRAARMTLRDHEQRRAACLAFGKDLLEALREFPLSIHGDPQLSLPHTLNLSIAGLPARRALAGLKDLLAFSNGSACTAQTQEPSHVLQAMGVTDQRQEEAIRLSWCHLTSRPDWAQVREVIAKLRGESV